MLIDSNSKTIIYLKLLVSAVYTVSKKTVDMFLCFGVIVQYLYNNITYFNDEHSI